jgi:predicted DCC family thiol-disulfide oxidoreductase YuxK
LKNDGRLRHLVFYDGQCGLCDHIVQFLLRVDKHEIFVFAPLQGETAEKLLAGLPENFKQIDSIILVENYQSPQPEIYVLSKAVFKICWLLGGVWALIGSLSFLPSYLFDWGYRLVAKNRHRFFPITECVIPSASQRERYLN